jgi:hypothetical protein
MGVIVLVRHWNVECFQTHCSSLRRNTRRVTTEYQFLELERKAYVKKGWLSTMFTNASSTELLGQQH